MTLARRSSIRLVSTVLLGGIVLGIAGCDSSPKPKEKGCPSGNAPEFAPDQPSFSDEELRCAVYTDYRFPDKFYQEDLSLPNRDGQASIYYENTVSIDSSNQWREFCTTDLGTARALSEKSAESSAYYRQLVDTTVTEKFFQFRRVYEQNPRDVLLSRVHRCSYFAPSDSFHFAVPLSPHEDGSIGLGTLASGPVTPSSVRELAEYFWFLSNYNIGGAAALSSISRPGAENIEHVIYGTSTTNGDFGICDEITLTSFSHRVDRETGRIRYDETPIRTVEARCPKD